VKTLLSPLPPSATRTVRCLGLNYAKHAAESNMPLPTYPILFYKPITSLAGPTASIPIPLMAQEYPGLDYECELVFVIGKPAANVKRENAAEYILGYSVGNDVSHREWQIKRGGGQWALGKGFDGWAPWGPGLVTDEALPKSIINPKGNGSSKGGARIWTKVNGETMQDSETGDLVFGVAELVEFLSRGTTLLPGDVIFTGTPAGVAMGRKPPNWLQDGDVVEVGLEGVGTITNKVVMVKEGSKL
jgi:2-keto-4-pentenoate hydratase/2-oxohepta-3-ene-1,7-dioic acid hydratase in catechol pathway